MFDGLQILSNTTKHDQTRSNSTKQGVQTVKCLVTTKCLMVFGRQTFPVVQGLNRLATHFNISMFGHQTMFDGVWLPNISRLSRALYSNYFFCFPKRWEDVRILTLLHVNQKPATPYVIRRKTIKDGNTKSLIHES